MTPTREKVFGVAAYFFCSSTMLVINKVVLKSIPLHSFVSCCQFIFASFALVAARQLGLVEFDGYEWSKVQPYMIYVLAFVLAIYCNMRALAASNVETVIVFRTCTPLCVAILEWMFLGRRLPSLRSTGSLCMVLVGTIGYVLSDKQFSLYGWVSYTWVGIYFVLICFEMTYGKHIISGTKMSNPVLGSVFYTNTLSILPMFLLGFGIFDELDRIPEVQWNLPASAILLLSCVVGLSISWAGFNCRNLLSATSFTMLGVMCKMGTEAINVVIWDHHATMTGIMWLMLCIVGGTLYKQAPMRDASEQQYELVTTEPESLQEEPESEAGVPEQAAGVPLEPEQQLESEAV